MSTKINNNLLRFSKPTHNHTIRMAAMFFTFLQSGMLALLSRIGFTLYKIEQLSVASAVGCWPRNKH